jgi:hypothetical protein
MSFASTQLCINDISPSPASLGSLNGVSLRRPVCLCSRFR